MFDLLLVNKTPGGDSELLFEFLLILGTGKVCKLCKLFQRVLCCNVVENIV